MRLWKRVISFLLVYVFFISTMFNSTVLTVEALSDIKVLSSERDLEAINGQTIIKVKNPEDQAFNKFLEENHITILSKQENYLLVEHETVSTDTLVEKLKSNENVLYVEKNAKGTKSGEATNDPMLNTQDYLFYGNILGLWEKITPEMKKQQVVVAVVDSGVRSDHPDLVGRILSNGKSLLDNSTNTNDENGHGTQMAGIIAANSNNSKGITGVAKDLNVKILPVKVLDAKGEGTSFNVAAGIRYAADNGANIINISINGSGYSSVINDAVNYAIAKGVVIIGSKKDGWPSNCENIITAGDVGQVKLPWAMGQTTTINNGGYTYVRGNSVASAVISGVASVIKSSSPSINQEQIKGKLQKGNEDWMKYNSTKAFDEKMEFLVVNSPNVVKQSLGDVKVKLQALKPQEVGKMDIYLNGSTSPMSATNVTGTDNYEAIIPQAKVIIGINKLSIKAYDKSGKLYEYNHYFKAYETSKGVTLTLKDAAGKTLPKDVTVNLREKTDSDEVKPAIAVTDANGKVVFYNVKSDKEYTIEVAYGPYYFVKTLKNITDSIITLPQTKVLTITAKKADGTFLKGDKLLVNGHDFTSTIDVNGVSKIYTTDEAEATVEYIGEKEGYYYKKYFENLSGVSSVPFVIDSSMAKININRSIFTNVLKEYITLNQNYNADEKVTNIDVKNGVVFLPKETKSRDDYRQEYFFRYTAVLNNANKDTYTFTNYIDLQNTNEVVIGKNLKLTGNVYANHNNSNIIDLGLSDDYNNYLDFRSSNYDTNFKLYKTTGELIDSSLYSWKDTNGGKIEIDYREALPIGEYQGEVTVTLGEGLVYKRSNIKLENRESYQYDNPSGLTAEIKAPFDNISKIEEVRYRIFDEQDKSLYVNQGREYTFDNGILKLPVELYRENKNIEKILVSVKTDKGSFVYLRDANIVDNKIILNNSKGIAKKVNFSYSSTGLKNNLSNSQMYLKYTLGFHEDLTSDLKINLDNLGNSELWLDNGVYNVTLANEESNYFVRKTAEIAPFNSEIRFDDLEFSKVSFKSQGYFGLDNVAVPIPVEIVSHNKPSEIQVKPGEVLNITPNIDLSGTTASFIGNYGRKYNITLEGFSPLVKGQSKEIYLDNLVVEPVNSEVDIQLPEAVSIPVKVTIGGVTVSENSTEEFLDLLSNELGDEEKGLFKIKLYDANNRVLEKETRLTTDYRNGNLTLNFNDIKLSGRYKVEVYDNINNKKVNSKDSYINVDSSGIIKVRVMSPLDINKPAKGVRVSDSYVTNELGFVYIPIDELKEPVNFKFKEGSSIFAYSIPKMELINNPVVTKTASSFVKYNFSITNNISNIDTAAITMDLKRNGYVMYNDYNLEDISTYGVSNLYLSDKEWTIKYKGRNLISKINIEDLSTNNIAFNTGNLVQIKPNIEVTSRDSIAINFEGNDRERSYTLSKSSTFYTDKNLMISYNFRNSNTNINYTGKITTEAGKVNYINIGDNITVNPQIIGSLDNIKAGDRITSSISLKDEYSNNVSLNYGPGSMLTTKVQIETLNGEKHIVDGEGYYGYEGSQLYFNIPKLVSGQCNITYIFEFGSARLLSSPIVLNIAKNDVYGFLVKSPENAKVAYGKVTVSRQANFDGPGTYTSDIDKSGMAYIEKSYLNSNEKYVIRAEAVDENGNIFEYNNRAFDFKDITELSNVNSKKVNIKIDNLNIGHTFSLQIKVMGQNKTITVEDGKTPVMPVNYKDFNFWSDALESYYASVTFSVFDNAGGYNPTGYLLTTPKIDFNQLKNVVIDGSKLVKTEFKCANGEGKPNHVSTRISEMSNYSSSFLNFYRFYGISTLYATAGVYDIQIAKDENSPMGYSSENYTKAKVKIDEGNNLIQFGGTLKVKDLQKYIEERVYDVPTIGHVSASFIDEYGFDVSMNPNTSGYKWKAEVYNLDGTKNMEKSVNSQSIYSLKLEGLSTGIYDIQYTLYKNNIEIYRSKKFKTTFYKEDEEYIGLRADVEGSLRIYDEDNKEVLNNNEANSYNVIPKAFIDLNKKYYAEVTGVKNENGAKSLVVYNSELDFSNLSSYGTPYISIEAPEGLIELDVKDNLLNGGTVKLSSGMEFNLDKYFKYSYNSVPINKVKVQSGKGFTLVKEHIDGLSKSKYFINETYAPTMLDKELKLNPLKFSQLVINNVMATSMRRTMNVLTAKVSPEITFTVNNNEVVYIPKGEYALKAEMTPRGTSQAITASYLVNASNSTTDMNIGKNLTMTGSLNSSNMTVGDKLNYTVSAVYDGAIKLEGAESILNTLGAKIDIMHGERALRNFDKVPSIVSGNMKIRANFNHIISGLASKTYEVNVSNRYMEPVFSSDINLDNITDIFDLVLVARDLGNTKATSKNWDSRTDVYNEDNGNIIDVKDIAKVAKFYNK